MSLLKRQREGYLLVDHTDSPGIPGAFAAGKKFESSTLTCAHCNCIVILRPDRKRPRHYCAKCDHYVCDNPACGLECRPFKKVLDDLHHQATVANLS